MKRHAWKACIPLKGIGGSNPPLSARAGKAARKSQLFYFGEQPGLPEAARQNKKVAFRHFPALAGMPPAGRGTASCASQSLPRPTMPRIPKMPTDASAESPPAGKGKASCASQSSPANDAAQSEKRCPRCSAGSPPTGRGKQTTKVLNIRFLTFNGRTSRIDIRLRSTRHSGDRRAFPPAETDDSTVHGQEFDDLFLYLPKRTGNTKIGTVFVFVETTISNMPYENKPS